MFRKVVKKEVKKRLYKKISNFYEEKIGTFFFKQKGFCPCCEKEVNFVANHHWLRDHFLCSNCGCLPRERALMLTISREFPNWKTLHIHESSPGRRGHSLTLKNNNKNYLESQYFEYRPFGELTNGVRNEDLENQTFNNDSFDLVVTSDVMEHIYDPVKAFKEIHRTLKPGGAHIFSVPLVNKHEPTQRWAVRGKDGGPDFLFTPEWHGNPVNEKGSPVTMHWGFDIVDYIAENTGANCKIIYIDELEYGIRAEYIEIIVARKKLE